MGHPQLFTQRKLSSLTELPGYHTLEPDSQQDELVALGQENGTSIFQKMKIFITLMPKAFYLGFSNYGYDLLNLYGFYLSSKTGNVEVQSSFGLMIFFDTLLILGIFYAIDEKVGVTTSLLFGKGDYLAAKRTYWQGYLTLAILTLFYFGPVVVFSNLLFLTLGFKESSSRITSRFLQKLYLIEALRMINGLSLTYSIAQGVDFNYGLFALISMIVSFLNGIAMNQWLHLGIDGWLVSRLTHELLMSIIIFYAFCTLTDRRSRGVLAFKEIKKEYGEFLFGCMVYGGSLYSEWVGCEIAIFFTTRTHNLAQIAAHTALQNIAYCAVNTGLGFSCIGRQKLNMLLGMGHRKAAKKFFFLFLIGMLATGAFISIIVWCFVDKISHIYVGTDLETLTWMNRILTLYCAFLPLDFLFPFIFTACRSTGNVALSLILNVIFLIGYCSTSDYFLIYKYQQTCFALIFNTYVTIFGIFSALILRLQLADWNTFDLDLED